MIWRVKKKDFVNTGEFWPYWCMNVGFRQDNWREIYQNYRYMRCYMSDGFRNDYWRKIYRYYRSTMLLYEWWLQRGLLNGKLSELSTCHITIWVMASKSTIKGKAIGIIVLYVSIWVMASVRIIEGKLSELSFYHVTIWVMSWVRTIGGKAMGIIYHVVTWSRSITCQNLYSRQSSFVGCIWIWRPSWDHQRKQKEIKKNNEFLMRNLSNNQHSSDFYNSSFFMYYH